MCINWRFNVLSIKMNVDILTQHVWLSLCSEYFIVAMREIFQNRVIQTDRQAPSLRVRDWEGERKRMRNILLCHKPKPISIDWNTIEFLSDKLENQLSISTPHTSAHTHTNIVCDRPCMFGTRFHIQCIIPFVVWLIFCPWYEYSHWQWFVIFFRFGNGWFIFMALFRIVDMGQQRFAHTHTCQSFGPVRLRELCAQPYFSIWCGLYDTERLGSDRYAQIYTNYLIMHCRVMR